MISAREKYEARNRYVKLSFLMLSLMVISLGVMGMLGVDAAIIQAVSVGYIGLGASFAAVIATHLGTQIKSNKDDQ